MTVVTARVDAVTRKEGTSKKTGKPFTKYIVHAADQEFDTFDAAHAAAANGLVNQLAEIEFEIGKFGRDLKAIKEAPKDAQAEQVFREASQDGPDWDVIGLRKTRCVIWEQLIAPAMSHALIEFTRDEKNRAPSDVAGFVAQFGKRLRQIAEADIYSDNAPAQDTDWIPF